MFQDPIKEFWDHSKTADEIEVRGYFGQGQSWPGPLNSIFAERKNSFSAFGSLTSYLRVLKLDQELLSYADISEYKIMEGANSMILDGQAVDHLSICSQTQDQRNTLMGIVDRTSTAFGHRKLRSWLLHPLYFSKDIVNRQDAVLALMEDFGTLSDITKSLKTLPDLERLCTRVHSGTLPIKTFVTVLNALNTILSLRESISKDSTLMSSSLISSIVSSIPDFSEDLGFFFSSFDHSVALRDGVVEMTPGSFTDLDSAKSIVSDLEKKFSDYLKDQELRLK